MNPLSFFPAILDLRVPPNEHRCTHWKPAVAAKVARSRCRRMLDRSRFAFLPRTGIACALTVICLAATPLHLTAKADREELISGNRRAEELASRSKIVMGSFQYLRATAIRIADPELRKQVLKLLDNPAPTFYQEWPTRAAKEEVYNALLAHGFVQAEDGRFPNGSVMEGIFPPVPDPARSPQRFWAAPGGAFDSHHSYPGGLVIHEAFNLRCALSLAADYREQYPKMVINDDYIIAAPIWHDAMKTVVFQWTSDESELPELVIAGTGAHHILGLAEALHRNLPPRLVIAIAAAHGTPGFEPSGKITGWLEAASLLAHVDPITYGVLKKSPISAPDGSGSPSELELPWPVSPEAAIDNLSDGNYVFSIPAAHFAIEKLGELGRTELKMDQAALGGRLFNDFRNRVFSQMTQERFYTLWLEGSSPAVLSELRRLGLLHGR